MEELQRLISRMRHPRHRTLLMMTYAAGLRVSDVVHLQLTDIASDRMLIRVEQGKGRKDCSTLLSPFGAVGAGLPSLVVGIVWRWAVREWPELQGSLRTASGLSRALFPAAGLSPWPSEAFSEKVALRREHSVITS